MTSDDWGWRLYPRARQQFEALDDHARDRIESKLEEIVTDEWRDPDAYVEPLTGVPHSKLRVGQFRLGCELDHDAHEIQIYTIDRRENAYQPGDD